MFCFGAFESGVMQGIVTYGMPPSPQVGRGFLGESLRTNVLELNRLCVNSTARKNTSSMLVGRSLKMLPSDKYFAVVSYADGSVGHIGYIYQATNFIYCGAKKSHDVEYLIDNRWVHAKVLTNRGITAPRKWAKENGIEIKKPKEKHRYVYFINKKYINYLKYDKKDYPKGDSKRYDCIDVVKGSK